MNDNPWFLRRGSGWCSSIRPAGFKGWMLTGLFVGVIEFTALRIQKHDGAYWPVSLVVIAAMTILFATATWRLSVRDPNPTRRGCGKEC